MVCLPWLSRVDLLIHVSLRKFPRDFISTTCHHDGVECVMIASESPPRLGTKVVDVTIPEPVCVLFGG